MKTVGPLWCSGGPRRHSCASAGPAIIAVAEPRIARRVSGIGREATLRMIVPPFNECWMFFEYFEQPTVYQLPWRPEARLCLLLAHRDGRRFDGHPSLSGHCGHGPIFIVQRSVANDPPELKSIDMFPRATHRASFCINTVNASAIKSGRSRTMK